jgi:hypothetical protein
VRYLECSAKHKRGVKECFQEAAKVALSGIKKNKKKKKKENHPTTVLLILKCALLCYYTYLVKLNSSSHDRKTKCILL